MLSCGPPVIIEWSSAQRDNTVDPFYHPAPDCYDLALNRTMYPVNRGGR